LRISPVFRAKSRLVSGLPGRWIDSGNWANADSPGPISELCSSLVARYGGAALPEMSVNTEIFPVRIIISPALPQKFPKIDGFEQRPRGHII
jgi:hypothetical protein